MSIYTRGGDTGDTSLADGTRVPKSSARVEAYGSVDEANSAVGLARVAIADKLLSAILEFVQQKLFNCSSLLATPAEARGERTPRITDADVAFLERAIDRFEEACGPMTGFVLECGCETAARLHVARAAVRKAERRVVAMNAEQPVDPQILAFLNRCSDLLFSAARYANTLASCAEQHWDPKAPAPEI
jgi:cob(I)alamin adenosyltransferase